MKHWKALTLAAVVAIAAPAARAADGDAAPTKEVTKSVTHENGAQTTVDKKVAKTPAGKTVSKAKTTTSAKGATRTAHTTSTVTHDAKGHATRSAHKEVTAKTAKGKAVSKTVDQKAQVTKTSTGKHVAKSVSKDVTKTPAPGN
jgi:hypothetical protein